MKKLLIAFALTMTTSAHAADIIMPHTPETITIAPYAFSWDGAYIGAHGGYGWSKNNDSGNSRSPTKKGKGGFGGLQAGYNWQLNNNIVLGVEGDISFGDIKKKWVEAKDGKEEFSSNSSYYTKNKIGTHGTIRGRVGYAADRFLPYITGGVAIADTKNTLGCTGIKPIIAGECKDPSEKFETNESKTRIGYAVGAGLEYAVYQNWTIKAEYLYSDFGKKSIKLVDPNLAIGEAGNSRKFKTSLSEVRFGVNYKF